MAIWQFGVIFIPKSEISSEGEGLPASIPMEMTDHLWWSEQQPPQGFEKQIDLILSRSKSWSEQMQIWGDESGNDAYVCYTDGEKKVVEEIAFRLDACDISLDLIRMICTLAAQLSCVLLIADSEVLQPVAYTRSEIVTPGSGRITGKPELTLRVGEVKGKSSRQHDHAPEKGESV